MAYLGALLSIYIFVVALWTSTIVNMPVSNPPVIPVYDGQPVTKW